MRQAKGWGVILIKPDQKEPAINFKFINWKGLLLAAIVLFYFLLFGLWISEGDFPAKYGVDYTAFWSIGKIADEKGYSQIYDLNNLRIVQIQERQTLGLPVNTDISSYSPIPAPFFAFFVPPFQLLSRIDPLSGYWIWTLFNLALLILYLVFFINKIFPASGTKGIGLNVLILMLISFPVFFNIITGQVEVLLLICAGEFLRNSLRKKPILSGVWLGGLLLKPQLLILIVPLFFIMRNWKVLAGFIVSAGTIAATSLMLSGISGMAAMINLWVKYSGNLATTDPAIMINWRMIGVNLNTLLNTSLGWIITALGMVLTTLAVYFLVRHKRPYGSPAWVMTMTGVFAATLAITWHSHYHMALVLIPFLVYASMNQLIPEKIVFLWVTVTPIAWFVMGIISGFAPPIAAVNGQGMTFAFCGFMLNLAILAAAIRFTHKKSTINAQ